MRGVVLLLSLTMIISSCSAIPKIFPVNSTKPFHISSLCNTPFLNENWQLTHSINALSPDGANRIMIGIILISPTKRTMECTLMTIEGFVLFDARFNEKLIIRRAIPPFDSKKFANGLINDIKLIFLKPTAEQIESGILANGDDVCRYSLPFNKTMDVTLDHEENWRLDLYHKNKLSRSVKAAFAKEDKSTTTKDRIPHRIELQAHGMMGYELTLELLDAQKLKPKS